MTVTYPELTPKAWEAAMALVCAISPDDDGDFDEDLEDPYNWAQEDFSMPDGSWAIHNIDDLKVAIDHARAGSGLDFVRRHIMRRADDLGQSDLIPDEWNEMYPDWQRMDASEERRMELAKRGLALPDGSVAIVTLDHLKSEIETVDPAKAEAVAHIKKRAIALGASSLIPSDWK